MAYLGLKPKSYHNIKVLSTILTNTFPHHTLKNLMP